MDFSTPVKRELLQSLESRAKIDVDGAIGKLRKPDE